MKTKLLRKLRKKAKKKIYLIRTDKEDMEEKKLNLKPFDLQKAKEGKPVCTRDGRKARIICFDRDWDMHIVALIADPLGESVHYYLSNGKVDFDKQNDEDLMMLSLRVSTLVRCLLYASRNRISLRVPSNLMLK